MIYVTIFLTFYLHRSNNQIDKKLAFTGEEKTCQNAATEIFVIFFSQLHASFFNHFMWLKSVSLSCHGLLIDHSTYARYFIHFSTRPRFPPLLVLIYTFFNSQKIDQDLNTQGTWTTWFSLKSVLCNIGLTAQPSILLDFSNWRQNLTSVPKGYSSSPLTSKKQYIFWS